MSPTKATKRIRVRKDCSREGCTLKSYRGGVCRKHGTKENGSICKYEGCTNQTSSQGLCITHGAKKQKKSTCSVEGCTTLAKGKGGMCHRHGAKNTTKLCKVEGCTSQASTVREGVCRRHGARNRTSFCSHEGCTTRAFRGGVCHKHNENKALYYSKPIKLCKVEGCTSQAITVREGVCCRHGAQKGKRKQSELCSHEGCITKAIRGGFCWTHDENKELCNIVGCERQALRSGTLCINHHNEKHNNMMLSSTSSSSANARKYRYQVKKECSHEGCTLKSHRGGTCRKHGTKENGCICSQEGCTKQSVKHGVCYRHGGKEHLEKPTCSAEGCTTLSRAGGMCHRHGANEVPNCKVEGCAWKATSAKKGACMRHGAKEKTRNGKRKRIMPSRREGICSVVDNNDGGRDTNTVSGLIVHDYSSSSEEDISDGDGDGDGDGGNDMQIMGTPVDRGNTSHREKDNGINLSSGQEDDINDIVYEMGTYSERSAGDGDMKTTTKKTGEDETSHLEENSDSLSSEDEDENDDDVNISVDGVDMDSEISEGETKASIKKYTYDQTGRRHRMCNREGCNHRALNNQGFCRQHGAINMTCSQKGCTNEAYSKSIGLCARHKKQIAVKNALPVPNDHYDFLTTCTCFSKSGTFCGMHDRYPLDKNDAKSGIHFGETNDDDDTDTAKIRVSKVGLCNTHNGEEEEKRAVCERKGCRYRAKRGIFCIKHAADLCNHEGCTNQIREGGFCYKHGVDLRTNHSQPTIGKREGLCEYRSCHLRAKSGMFCEFHARRLSEKT